MKMDKVYQLLIQGRVQRVWFRGWAVRTAQQIGEISGFVKNLENGDVEIVIKGKEENLQRMINACYVGPALARVDYIVLKDMSESLEYRDIGDIFTRK